MNGLLSAKMLVLLAVGLIVLGPEKLPDVARTAGRLLSEFRRVSSSLQEEVSSAFGADVSAPLTEWRATTDNLRSTVSTWTATTASGTTVVGSDGTVPASAAPPTASYRVIPEDELGFPPGDPSLN